METKAVLGPEMRRKLLSTSAERLRFPRDLDAYSGRAEAEEADMRRRLEQVPRLPFLEPSGVQWLDARHELLQQLAGYEFLAPVVPEGRLLQIGGTGLHAVKFLLGGARTAWHVSPVQEELQLGQRLARAAGVESRYFGVKGLGEDMPFLDGAFDGAWAGGVVHHTHVSDLATEVSRVLRPRGKFAATEPVATFRHSVGTRLFGKREAGVDCVPLTRSELARFSASFGGVTRLDYGGHFFRYLGLLAEKFGYRLSLSGALRLANWDAGLAQISPDSRFATCVAVLCERSSR